MTYKDPSVFEPLKVSVVQGGTESEREKTEWLEQNLFVPMDDAGFAQTQEEYEQAYDRVFEALDTVDAFLKENRYLSGDKITYADVLLYSVLVRFDSIFYFAYRLNRSKVKDFKHLFRYAKELYHMPAFHEATDFEELKVQYYSKQTDIQNPYHLLMLGPDQSDWNEEHEENRI